MKKFTLGLIGAVSLLILGLVSSGVLGQKLRLPFGVGKSTPKQLKPLTLTRTDAPRETPVQRKAREEKERIAAIRQKEVEAGLIPKPAAGRELPKLSRDQIEKLGVALLSRIRQHESEQRKQKEEKALAQAKRLQEIKRQQAQLAQARFKKTIEAQKKKPLPKLTKKQEAARKKAEKEAKRKAEAAKAAKKKAQKKAAGKKRGRR